MRCQRFIGGGVAATSLGAELGTATVDAPLALRLPHLGGAQRSPRLIPRASPATAVAVSARHRQRLDSAATAPRS